MTTLSKKRILIDIKNFKNDESQMKGIYAHFDEEDIYKAKAMIIGPEDTPYHNGFYFFDIEFPKNYPLYPPKVKFQTLDNRIRFNPNLYKCGKVCVSILGTWSGPGWTSVMTFTNVLVSIQSLLNSKPIQNEPGFENETGERCIKYNQTIEYFNYEVAILNMFSRPPPTFEVFKPIMEKHICDNINHFINVVDSKRHLDNQHIKTNIYGLYVKPEYAVLLDRFKKLKSDLNIIDIPKKIDKEVEAEQDSNSSKKKLFRKSPSESSKKYKIGDVIKSDNDGNMWKVVKFGDTTRWMKVID